MNDIKYIRTLLKILFKEKYILLLILSIVSFLYFVLGDKFTGSAVKGRFTIDIGSYYLADQEQGMILTPIEKPEYLVAYLKSYEFFYLTNKKKCLITLNDLHKRNYSIIQKDFFVDIILRFNETDKVLTCLKAMKENISNRHKIRFDNYVGELDAQIENLKQFFEENRDDLPTEELKQYSIARLQAQLMPIVMYRDSLIRTYKQTKFVNERSYEVKSSYYSSKIIGSAICLVLSLSLFLVYIFIKHQKKLKF